MTNRELLDNRIESCGYRFDYGSTFFNSGYEDYLDANYEPPPNLKIDESMDDLDFY